MLTDGKSHAGTTGLGFMKLMYAIKIRNSKLFFGGKSWRKRIYK